MKKNFVANQKNRVLWAMCIAAYILVADYYSPLSIIRAELDEGNMVEERPLGATPAEDRFMILVATLAMYAALDPDTYAATYSGPMPATVTDMIAEMLRASGETASEEDVMREQNRLQEIAADILRKNHMYHLHLAAALMKGPVTAEMMQELKAVYCDNLDHVA